jgi:hypothetical protein
MMPIERVPAGREWQSWEAGSDSLASLCFQWVPAADVIGQQV